MYSQKLKNGKVRFFESAKNPLSGEIKTFSVTMDKETNATRKAAEKVLQERIRQYMVSKSTVPNKSLTVGELIQTFNESRKKDPAVKESTAKASECASKAVERLLGENTLVSALSAGYIKKQLINANEEPVRMNGRLKTIKTILNWGYHNDLVDDVSYLDKIKKWKEPKSYTKRIEDYYLERDELSALIDGIDSVSYRLIIKFLALSGLRIGEFIALRRQDVDFKNRTISVRQSMQSNTGIVDLPKNEPSYRTFHMQDELYDVAVQMFRHSAVTCHIFNIHSDIFFPSPDGGYLKHRTVEKYISENGERILHRRVTPHMLRHTYVSLTVEESVLSDIPITLDDIAERLGHSSSVITKRIYFHKTDKTKKVVDERMDKIKIFS